MDKNDVSCRIAKVGGQAVIGGIMMKGPKHYSTAVRCPDGSIITDDHDNKSVKDKYKILRLPIIRGIVNYIETMALSFKTLDFAANAMGMDEEETKFEKWLNEKFGKSIMTVAAMIGGVLGVALALFLFIYIPALISDLVFKPDSVYFLRKLFEGGIKIAIFAGYILLISLMPDIKKMFRYHGAEHKSIFCFEKGLDLTVENIKKQSRFHPRCGTSFLFVMMILGILISSLFKIDNRLLYVLYKVLTLPVLVGLGYEIIIFSGKHDNFIMRILTAPGLWMQRLTTAEPDDSMMEVAIVALKSALPEVFAPEKIPESGDFRYDGAAEKKSDGDTGSAAKEGADPEKAAITDNTEKDEKTNNENAR